MYMVGMFAVISYLFIVNLLISRIFGPHCTHVTGALYIILSTQRIDAAPALSDLTAEHCGCGEELPAMT